MSLSAVRPALGVAEQPLVSCLASLQVKRSRSKGGLAGPDGTKSVFGQMCAKMSSFSPDSLLLPHRVWKVKFVGESLSCSGSLQLPGGREGGQCPAEGHRPPEAPAHRPSPPQVSPWMTAEAATASP